jgi:hypothetical protein
MFKIPSSSIENIIKIDKIEKKSNNLLQLIDILKQNEQKEEKIHILLQSIKELEEKEQKTKKILIEDIFNNQITHLLYDEKVCEHNHDYIFDEDNDILIDDIKKIICSKNYQKLKDDINKTNYMFSHINDDEFTEKKLRIIIVLLYQNHENFHEIIKEICEILLKGKSDTLINKIKIFYEFTTGIKLNMD